MFWQVFGMFGVGAFLFITLVLLVRKLRPAHVNENGQLPFIDVFFQAVGRARSSKQEPPGDRLG